MTSLVATARCGVSQPVGASGERAMDHDVGGASHRSSPNGLIHSRPRNFAARSAVPASPCGLRRYYRLAEVFVQCFAVFQREGSNSASSRGTSVLMSSYSSKKTSFPSFQISTRGATHAVPRRS